MVKRKSSPPQDTPEAAVKRLRTESTQSPAAAKAPQLSTEERSKLSKWLDKQEEKGPVFDVAFLAADAKKSKGGGWSREQFMLNGRVYLPDCEYSVKPKVKWDSLSKFRKCTVGEETFEPGQCVLVHGIDNEENSEHESRAGINSLAQWKALLHEIRALDANHVYLRVSWLMRPQDLDGGAKPYHGRYELIPSNDMSIINAMSINGSIDVKHWDEYVDTEVPIADEYFYRQTLNRKELSKCRQYCICKQVHNPDELIVGCGKGHWLHATCLTDNAVKQAAKVSVNGTSASSVAVGNSRNTNSNDSSKEVQIEADILIRGANGHPVSERSKIIVTDRRSGRPVVTEKPVFCLECTDKTKIE